MKTTKTIEIEVCEKCGNETHPYKCSRCGVECCDRCADVIHVAVDLYHPNSPQRYGGMFSTNVRRTHEKKSSNFCVPCSSEITNFLTANKFATEIVKSYVVED